MLAKTKLSGFENLISQARLDMQISREEFVTVLKEKDKYKEVKENIRNVN